jgi:hypothetical protein
MDLFAHCASELTRLSALYVPWAEAGTAAVFVRVELDVILVVGIEVLPMRGHVPSRVQNAQSFVGVSVRWGNRVEGVDGSRVELVC